MGCYAETLPPTAVLQSPAFAVIRAALAGNQEVEAGAAKWEIQSKIKQAKFYSFKEKSQLVYYRMQ